MTPEQLKKKALRLGGAIEHDGKTFNAGRAKGPYAPTPAPPPETKPVAPTAPPVAQEPAKPSAELLACLHMMMEATQEQAKSSAAIETALAKIKPPMGPVTHWKWTVTRDDFGRVKTFEAQALKQGA